MIEPDLKAQFEAAALRAWGTKAPPNSDRKNGDDADEGSTKYERQRYYSVLTTTFNVDTIDGEKCYGRGEGTHRAFMLYRLMRKDIHQLETALKDVRSAMRLGKTKGGIYKIISEALKGRE